MARTVAQAVSTAPAPSPAVAPPPGNPRFPLLDSIRGLAVLVVIGFHVSAITGVPHGPFPPAPAGIDAPASDRPGKFTVELQATDRISKKTAKLSLPLTSVEQKSNRGAAEK